jgi:hypothetical protein
MGVWPLVGAVGPFGFDIGGEIGGKISYPCLCQIGSGTGLTKALILRKNLGAAKPEHEIRPVPRKKVEYWVYIQYKGAITAGPVNPDTDPDTNKFKRLTKRNRHHGSSRYRVK